jgi:hypothetical protein
VARDICEALREAREDLDARREVNEVRDARDASEANELEEVLRTVRGAGVERGAQGVVSMSTPSSLNLEVREVTDVREESGAFWLGLLVDESVRMASSDFDVAGVEGKAGEATDWGRYELSMDVLEGIFGCRTAFKRQFASCQRRAGEIRASVTRDSVDIAETLEETFLVAVDSSSDETAATETQELLGVILILVADPAAEPMP